MFIKCSNKSIPIPFPLILLPISHSSLPISPSPTSKFNLFPYLDPAGAGTTASTVAGSRAIAAKAVLLDPTSWLLKYIWLSTFNKINSLKMNESSLILKAHTSKIIIRWYSYVIRALKFWSTGCQRQLEFLRWQARV